MNATTGSDTVRLTRTIGAPPGEVYRAFLEPDRLRQWFGPRDFVVTDVEVDPRVGGRHRTQGWNESLDKLEAVFS